MSAELVVLRGLPASGKTAWARNWVELAPRRARVNRDDLRAQLFGAIGAAYASYFDDKDNLHVKEAAVSVAERRAVGGLLEDGFSVVVDSTNLRLRYLRQWRELAYDYDVEFKIEDFMFRVPVDECVRRDQLRYPNVGEEVILSMHRRFKGTKIDLDDARPSWKYEPDETLPGAWIFDIDGTLALNEGHRSPYDYSLVEGDVPNVPVIDLANELTWDRPSSLIIVSGRDDACRDATVRWLKRYFVAYAAIFMREAGDRRDDAIVKLEILRDKIAPRWRVYGVFDDRNRVIRMWRDVGLLCCQVNYGAF